eukprot:m.98149 g.98149  ORF g.98149 m.98149 type:complete len:962 (+) comp9001_c0_seq2:161-3046(+)
MMDGWFEEKVGFENQIVSQLEGFCLDENNGTELCADYFLLLVKSRRHQGEHAIFCGQRDQSNFEVNLRHAFPIFESTMVTAKYTSCDSGPDKASDPVQVSALVINGEIASFEELGEENGFEHEEERLDMEQRKMELETQPNSELVSAAVEKDIPTTQNGDVGTPVTLRPKQEKSNMLMLRKKSDNFPLIYVAKGTPVNLQEVEKFILDVSVATEIASRHKFRRECHSHSWVDELLWKMLSQENQSRCIFKGAHKSCTNSTAQWHGDWASNSGWKDDYIKIELARQAKKYTDYEPFHLVIGTFNVNGRSPVLNDNGDVVSLTPWLLDRIADEPDMYALGFQEADLSKEAFLFGESKREDEWAVIIANTLGESYTELHRKRLVGMYLIVFVKKNMKHYISELKTDMQGTGLMNVMGNKGGVALKLRVKDSSLCFVTTHLAARDENVARRNQDYEELCRRLTFDKGTEYESGIFDSDFLFWFGDLNYRIEGEDSAIKAASNSGNIQYLLQRDQLSEQRKQNRVFFSFVEPAIDFKPTYKYDIGTDRFDTSEKKRSPAYCDRILFYTKTTSNNEVCIREYTSAPEIRISDHKPVRGQFTLSVSVVDPKRQQDTMNSIFRELDVIENDSLPDVELSCQAFEFQNVRFDRKQEQELRIKNIGKVKAQFSFIPKHGDTEVHPSWLRINKRGGILSQGEETTITLTMHVRMEDACNLNTEQETLDDVLIFHVENGNDFFITVNGSWLPTFLCRPLLDLCYLNVPAREMLRVEHEGQLNELPKELWLLVDFLVRHGLKKPDLFKTGSRTHDMWIVVESLDEGLDIPMVASTGAVLRVLRLFLTSLPESIIPQSLYSRCVENARNHLLCTKVIEELPMCNKIVFNYLLRFFKEILKYKNTNDSDLETLLRLFGPAILRSKQKSSVTQFQLRSEIEFFKHFFVDMDNEDSCNGKDKEKSEAEEEEGAETVKY